MDNQDVFLSICENITNVKKLISLELLSKCHMRMIRAHNWNTFQLNIKSKEQLMKMSLHHTFLNIKICISEITDEIISKLIHCYELDLTWCQNITDDHVSLLVNCCILNLSGLKITDKSVSLLINCHTLYLRHTDITDKSVSKLVNCDTLDLRWTNITDESVSLLINCREVWVSGKITKQCVNILKQHGVDCYHAI